MCGLSHCDGTIRCPTGTFHFLTRVDGNLGQVNAPSSTITLPIVDATWFTVADSDDAIALDCGLGRTLALSPSTTEIQLTGVVSLTACTRTALTPSSELFRLRW